MAATTPVGKRMRSCPGQQRGLGFLALLFVIALAGVALAGTGALWQLESRREKEKELLFIGEQYSRALGSYYARTPGNAKQFPERLEDLLLDPRFPMPVRHLRRLYRDPMRPESHWELLREQGRIVGVVSTSDDQPVKISGFPEAFKEFEGAKSYRQWQFRGSPVAGAEQQ